MSLNCCLVQVYRERIFAIDPAFNIFADQSLSSDALSHFCEWYFDSPIHLQTKIAVEFAELSRPTHGDTNVANGQLQE